jgi:hypothetical protein
MNLIPSPMPLHVVAGQPHKLEIVVTHAPADAEVGG